VNGLTGLDMMVLLSLGVGAVFGVMRGFVSEVFSLGAWIAAIAAVRLFHAPVAVLLAVPVGNVGGASVLALALVFGSCFLVVRLVGASLGRRTRASVLGPVDRALGLGFGVLKGLLATTLVFLLMTLAFDTINGGRAPRPDWMTKSHSYTLLRASSAALVEAVESRRSK
jgi:membrane protein required for colicin V production